MSPTARDPSAFLELVAEYRHVRAAQRALSLWVPDEEQREAWRRHLHHGGPPPEPPPPQPPPVYRGTAEDGSDVEIRPGPAGEHHLFVDGAHRGPVEPVPDVLPPGGVLATAGMTCRERFAASEEALAALRAQVAGETGRPPWYAAELVADGLVDPDFGLTARGRRALAAGGTR